MVVVIYATPNPIIDERLESKVLPLIDKALEKLNIEAYALIDEDRIRLIIDEDESEIMKIVEELDKIPEYKQYEGLVVLG